MMLAGAIVGLPREELVVCEGCRRLVLLAGAVALDLPGGGWVVACSRCYDAEPLGRWRGLSVFWAGDRWLPQSDKGVGVAAD